LFQKIAVERALACHAGFHAGMFARHPVKPFNDVTQTGLGWAK
jgi:hypothetical protein